MIATNKRELMAAAQALARHDLSAAEQILRPRLNAQPDDILVLRLMAELATRLGRLEESETLLRRALRIAPGFAAARFHLATTLYRQGRPDEAVAELDRLLALNPDDGDAQKLKAAVHVRFGDADQALAIYETMLARDSDQADILMSYGHVLKTVGRRQEAVAAYRRATAAAPALGEAWWSLANLKIGALGEDDIDAISRALRQGGLSDADRLHLHFALGNALEDAGSYERSFTHYAEGNRIRRASIVHDPEVIAEFVRRAERLFTPAFFATRSGHGSSSRDPIFVLGMPRSGSTLVEQMLASHPLVEGTAELPDIPMLATELKRRSQTRDSHSLEWVGDLGAEESAALGEEYIRRTREHRKTDRPFFIDKLPNNWQHVGFIHLILPNARIVDVRRHPLACCFSNFKQHFARGQEFSYDQRELARYFADYVALLDHFDRVLPGRVHRVVYENMVHEPDTELRRLLEHLDLPFDEGCLRFHENERAVKTASSEQVRRPLNSGGLDRWRPYETFLAPMKEILGSLLEDQPIPPGRSG